MKLPMLTKADLNLLRVAVNLREEACEENDDRAGARRWFLLRRKIQTLSKGAEKIIFDYQDDKPQKKGKNSGRAR